MTKVKTARNIFLILAFLALLPLVWHGIAPMSLCWLQKEQMAACAFSAFLFTMLTGILTLDEL